MNKKIHTLNAGISLILCMASAVVYADDEAKADALTTTKMDVLVKAHGITQCKAPLTYLAADIFGIKRHKVLLNNKDERNLNQQTLYISAVLNYNDRNAFVQFTAHPLTNGKVCEVSYTQTLTVQDTCLSAREEVLKKWTHLGRLDNASHVYRHQRETTKEAFTTPIARGAHCLIMTRDNVTTETIGQHKQRKRKK